MNRLFVDQRAGGGALFGGASVDGTKPQMVGVLSATAIGATSFVLNWSPATDDVGGIRYEFSIDGGNTYTDVGTAISAVVSGRQPATNHLTRVRAVDGADNRADPLEALVTTLALVIGQPVDLPVRTVLLRLGDENGPAANRTGLMVSFHAASGPHATGLALYQSATESTDGNAVLTFSMQTEAIAAGDAGLLSVLMDDGHHYLGRVMVE